MLCGVLREHLTSTENICIDLKAMSGFKKLSDRSGQEFIARRYSESAPGAPPMTYSQQPPEPPSASVPPSTSHRPRESKTKQIRQLNDELEALRKQEKDAHEDFEKIFAAHKHSLSQHNEHLNQYETKLGA